MNSARHDPGLRIGETGTQRLIGWVTDTGHPDGRARVWLDITPDHTNRHGVLHGGIIATLLDSACGISGSMRADMATMPPMLSVSFTTQFLAPVSKGRVTAIGTVTGGGKRTMFIGAELTDEAGTLIATSTGVYKPVRQEHR